MRVLFHRKVRILCFGLLAMLLLGGLMGTVQAAEKNAKPAKPLFEEQVLFRDREIGYHTFRIPALVVTNKGTVLAFAEARKNNRNDHGDVDMAFKRSFDGGRTWSKARIIADDGDHTIGNPCPVVDSATGTIWLPYCQTNKRILIIKSTDDGKSWSKPVDVTETTTNPARHWFGTGPGHGIQMNNGRLVIPCWADATPKLGEVQLSYVFYSDDAGANWKVGAPLDANASDECEVVELANGDLYINARSRQRKRKRAVSFSKDGGETWSPVKFDSRLPEPSCQGAVHRLTSTGKFQKNRVLLATAANPNARSQMTVRVSYDECQSWPVSKVVRKGHSAYADLAVTHDDNILLFYETSNYAELTLSRFNVEWLTDGKDRLQRKKNR